MINKMEDSKILQYLLERNEIAISAVSEKYGKYCFKIARSILVNEQDVEDCVNDTLLRLWETVPPNRPEYIPAYLGRITRNIALDIVRSNTRQKRGGSEVELILDELAEVIPSGISIEETAEQHEILEAVNDFLRLLPKRKRKVFVLRYWHCQGVSDIARFVGMSDANVYNVLKRERKKLMDYLKKRGF